MTARRPKAQQPVVARKPLDRSLRRKTYPKPGKDRPETVDEFLARGGRIEHLEPGQVTDEEEE